MLSALFSGRFSPLIIRLVPEADRSLTQIYVRTSVLPSDHVAVVIHGEAILDDSEVKFTNLIERVLSMCPHNAEYRVHPFAYPCEFSEHVIELWHSPCGVSILERVVPSHPAPILVISPLLVDKDISLAVGFARIL